MKIIRDYRQYKRGGRLDGNESPAMLQMLRNKGVLIDDVNQLSEPTAQDLKIFLDQHGIEYPKNAGKKKLQELVNAI